MTKCPKTKCPKAKRRATSLRLLKCKFIIFKKIQQIKTDFPEKNEQKSFIILSYVQMQNTGLLKFFREKTKKT